MARPARSAARSDAAALARLSDPAAPLGLVLDTNVVLAFWHYRHPRLIALWRWLDARGARFFTRPDCLDELRRVLGFTCFGIDPARQDAIVDDYRARCRVLDATEALPALPRCDDPDDQRFVELAAQSGAHLLLTRDRLLLAMDGRVAARVVTPERLMKWLGDDPGGDTLRPSPRRTGGVGAIAMNLRIDHVVLWVEDPLKSVEFYERVLGVEGVRVEEFRAGKVLFPSLRLCAESLIDLMPLRAAPKLNAFPGAEGSAGNKVNHVCLALGREDYAALRARVDALGLAAPVTMTNSFGARGSAPEAFYFRDPDGNVIEARYYD